MPNYTLNVSLYRVFARSKRDEALGEGPEGFAVLG
jgi:hypothetical protein